MELAPCGSLTSRIISFARLLIGHIRDGLAQMNIPESCTADSAAVGGLMIPVKVKENYDGGDSGTENIWGKSFRWIDYSATIEAKTVGIAILGHRTNLH